MQEARQPVTTVGAWGSVTLGTQRVYSQSQSCPTPLEAEELGCLPSAPMGHQ